MVSQRVRILFLSHNCLFKKSDGGINNPRGGEKVFSSIINYLAGFGYDCSVIMPGREEGTSTRQDVRYFQLPIPKALCVHKWEPVKNRVMNLASEISPDVIVAYGSPLFLARDIHKKLGIPYVLRFGSARYLTEKDIPRDLEKGKMSVGYKRRFAPVFKDAAAILTNCNFGTRIIKKVYGVDSVAAYNYTELKPSFETSRKLVFAAPTDLPNSFASKIAEAMPDIQFITADFSGRLKGTDNLISERWIDDMDSVWTKTEMYLMPHLSGFPESVGTSTLLIESMARGIPVISEHKCGFAELNPLTVPRDTSIQTWVRKIRTVRKNWEKHSRQARSFLWEHYQPEQELEKIRLAIVGAIKRKRAFYCLGSAVGIGNVTETVPSIKALNALGYDVDVSVDPSQPVGQDFLKLLPGVRKVHRSIPRSLKGYDKLLSTHWGRNPFDLPVSAFEKGGIADKERAERHWYMAIPERLGFDGATPHATLNYSKKWHDIPLHSVAFAVGGVNKAWDVKRWEGFDKLIKYFASVILLGAKTDVLPDHKWPANVKNYIGKLSIADSLSMIKQCSMFIGNDGGLAHCAAALGIPTFVIFGPTSQVKNLPRGAYAIIRQPRLACQPCQFTDKFLSCRTKKCMEGLSVESVFRQISQLCGW